ncbi:trypsin-like peptidase domain-containing protein [Gemmata sp. JC717]|uniref:S1C family serine protease n=1 Tax=Gemmata algarum TaxID=2975278 RepID=UPI0021BB8FB8|nr:trypsin-like peptidase domain-containing protein [Gemmata algarum]MDY3552107.1 trypsin-like peptidase domain-containing protein [Gemmata algarum]
MTRLLSALLTALAGAVVSVSVAPAAPVEVDRSVLDAQKQRIAAIKKVHPAVVAVCMPDGGGCGSGVLIDPEGYALTNFHVVQPTGPFPTAGLADGVLYQAVVCGIDKVGDVALIKLVPKEKGKPFPFVPLADSDKVKAGDWSLAMGNPFSLAMDFTPTVTYGIVSGVNRYQPPEGKGLLEYTDCIQIETSINPGNSGGPLFNMNGELIGINGRGSFEKRGRVNSGVGYAISINQIKNFMGHLRAGIDSDHATLGAAVGSGSDEGQIPAMVVKQILEESDAARRGIENGDQLLDFGFGRPMTSVNAYKNALGIYPKEWRVPLTVRRNNTTQEYLVRLMGNQEKEREQPPGPGGPPMPPQPAPRPATPTPKGGDAATAGMYVAKPGYSNWYFNVLERDKVLAAFKKQAGDFSAVPNSLLIEGAFKMPDREGPMRAEVVEAKDGAKISLKLNIETTLEPLKQSDLTQQKMPLGSGGLMMALYHYHRFLALGEKGFEGLFAHGGNEPFYPYPVDGSVPKSLAALRVDCAVLLTKHGSVHGKWYFSLKDNTLLGLECYVAKDSKDGLEADPCELYFAGYKDFGGRKLPTRIEVRSSDKRYAVLEAAKWTLK